MRPSLTTTAPTCPLLHVLRRATMRAISMKRRYVTVSWSCRLVASHFRHVTLEDAWRLMMCMCRRPILTPYHVLNSSSSSVFFTACNTHWPSLHRHVERRRGSIRRKSHDLMK